MFTLSLLSCKDKVRSALIGKEYLGIWVIDSCFYKGEDYFSCLGVNSLGFKDTRVSLPSIDEECGGKSLFFGNNYTEWEIIRSDSCPLMMGLKSQTAEKVFDGKYKVEFYLRKLADKKGVEHDVLGMRLISKDFRIICNTNKYIYSLDKRLLDYLIAESDGRK